MELIVAQDFQAPLLRTHSGFQSLSAERQEEMRVASFVFPFRVNNYVVENLIDWSDAADPILRMTFPHREMLTPESYERLERVVRLDDGRALLETVREIRRELNPHPSGQMTINVPRLADGTRVEGVQHQYSHTALFFPKEGQHCHTFCSFCFRWPQFVGEASLRIEAPGVEPLIQYLHEHPEVHDLLITGGDPFVMRSVVLKRYVDALLGANLPQLTTIRFGTKALTYWPYRFTTDRDAQGILECMSAIRASGRHATVVAHFNHPVELGQAPVREAIDALRGVGVEIRTQTPLLRGINDSADTLAALWRAQVTSGCIPYYLFAARDTGAQHYFGVPLADAVRIYAGAVRQNSGLAATVRGPVMSTHVGKILVLDIRDVANETVFVLQLLHARNPEWSGRVFFARYSPTALWISELRPAFGEPRFFFET